MRQRILTILGVAVALLALYTIFFSARPGVKWSSAVGQASEQARSSLASEATGSAQESAGEEEVEAATTETASDEKAGRETDKTVAAAEEKQPETWGSDPFVRDWVMVNELAEMNLNAITIGGEKAYALINDQILEVGDVISGKRIVMIETDKVVLEQGGRTFDLLLGE